MTLDNNDQFTSIRAISEAIAAPLEIEDQVVQSMPDASPIKWHLAHVTWFFETFVLLPHDPTYRVFDGAFGFLFNSYYEAAGARHPRPERGLLSRPTLAEVLNYRAYVDAAISKFLAQIPDHGTVAALMKLGIQHEQQHQELMLMDILNLFAQNPLRPAYTTPINTPLSSLKGHIWHNFEGGLYTIGHNGGSFCFDNETPRHQIVLRPFALSDRLVTNEDYLAFMEDGAYSRPELWLSDGIATARANAWKAPLYWFYDDQHAWQQMTLHGVCPIEPKAPVGHLSFYEADAFARWAGHRLPTEAEWEVAAADVPPSGNTLGSGQLRPLPIGCGGKDQIFGDLWEWTSSPYVGYPGFSAPPGAVGEYNGKFMSGQMVLRGGSCVTPDGHLRATYRNFFYPHQRWAFLGLRLAKDL
ncbi:MAG: hypothetical protein CMM47_08675 [Rhodospirillaceae bacterium]|nr:hypothetical protein [Rhodospirillaceae bacterium]